MGEIQQAWAQKQKDDSRGCLIRNPTFPEEGNTQYLDYLDDTETDETYGGGAEKVHLESTEVGEGSGVKNEGEEGVQLISVLSKVLMGTLKEK